VAIVAPSRRRFGVAGKGVAPSHLPPACSTCSTGDMCMDLHCPRRGGKALDSFPWCQYRIPSLNSNSMRPCDRVATWMIQYTLGRIRGTAWTSPPSFLGDRLQPDARHAS
jgi:hypothetical protein